MPDFRKETTVCLYREYAVTEERSPYAQTERAALLQFRDSTLR
jgi:hypothetical protein